MLDWLSTLKLAQYVQAFVDNGYDDLEVCKQIGEPDLDAIGVRVQYHRHRLLSAVGRLREGDHRRSSGHYFTLEPLDPPPALQPEEETFTHQASCPGNHNPRFTHCNDFITYPKLKLKILIRDKLAKEGINLSKAPYTHKVRQSLSVHATLHLGDFYVLQTKMWWCRWWCSWWCRWWCTWWCRWWCLKPVNERMDVGDLRWWLI